MKGIIKQHKEFTVCRCGKIRLTSSSCEFNICTKCGSNSGIKVPQYRTILESISKLTKKGISIKSCELQNGKVVVHIEYPTSLIAMLLNRYPVNVVDLNLTCSFIPGGIINLTFDNEDALSHFSYWCPTNDDLINYKMSDKKQKDINLLSESGWKEELNPKIPLKY